MRKILFACAALILMPAVPAGGEPLVRMHTSYYYIDGPSATVLAAQLDQIGPVGSDGNHYPGRTR
jgi:predicted secreted Zn-dependent protease